jgi:hypothetical protein
VLTQINFQASTTPRHERAKKKKFLGEKEFGKEAEAAKFILIERKSERHDEDKHKLKGETFVHLPLLSCLHQALLFVWIHSVNKM